ncbi:hypothetical protein [Escherichia coli]|uniref:gp53-like domain-containing protein n=1 Tax=Escherichia coli TaxID=562 RepID=UPI003860157E
MHRIDTKTAQKDKFGAGKNGFTRGNPQTGTPATDLDDDYFDMLQEELCSVVEASGASLEKGRHDQLLTALRALLLSRKNPFGDIKSDGTVQTALENLGLGTAATKNVGTGAGQIPDMTSFSSGSGWQRLPSGVIIQWGTAISGQVGDAHENPFPIAFTDLASIQIVATYDNPDAPNGPVHFGAKANTTSSFSLLNSLPNANVAYARWIAIGR